jgi:hypothetical protein
MINFSYFKIQDAIEQYGIKNVRVFIPATPVDFSFFALTGVPFTLQSDSDEKTWAEYKIEECDPHHKIKLIPSEKYEITITSYGKETGKTNVFPNERYYVSDLNHIIRGGHARVYVETEDGLHLIYGVYEDILNTDEVKVLEWIKNFFNYQSVQTFA